jgi:hypothetical protein
MEPAARRHAFMRAVERGSRQRSPERRQTPSPTASRCLRDRYDRLDVPGGIPTSSTWERPVPSPPGCASADGCAFCPLRWSAWFCRNGNASNQSRDEGGHPHASARAGAQRHARGGRNLASDEGDHPADRVWRATSMSPVEPREVRSAERISAWFRVGRMMRPPLLSIPIGGSVHAVSCVADAERPRVARWRSSASVRRRHRQRLPARYDSCDDA